MGLVSIVAGVAIVALASFPSPPPPILETPQALDTGAPSGYYLDPQTDQVFYYDETTRTLVPAAGVEPQGLYDVDIVGPGQKPSVMTQELDACPTSKSFCSAWGWALVGGTRARYVQTVDDRCAQEPFEWEYSSVSTLPVMRFSMMSAASGGCCGTVYGRLFIHDRLRDDDSMFWRSSYGCP